MFRFLTAGESHGPALNVIVEGMPAGVPVSANRIDRELSRRQKGYGRGGRMQIEQDQAKIMAGVRHGQTLGSPVSLLIQNRDWPQWQVAMDQEKIPPREQRRALDRPRPGHADLVGALKYDRSDMRDILERSSARETAGRVAVGALAKTILELLGIRIGSWVSQIGTATAKISAEDPAEIWERAEASDVHCPDAKASIRMRRVIDQAKKNGDSLGGIINVAAWGMVPGLGSHVHWDRRLDMRLAGAIMSIPAIKGVELGMGFATAGLPGSRVHDVILYRRAGRNGGFTRQTNNAGGIEGGMSTGEPVMLRAAMKPIPTLVKPLASIDLRTKKKLVAGYERSDVCAVPAAAVVAEAMMAVVLVQTVQEKFGGDSFHELKRHWQAYQAYLQRR